jgi:hypothetical protein
MDKPNLCESYGPLPGPYSLKRDLRLNAWLMVATVTYLVGLYLMRKNPGWGPPTRALLTLAPLAPGMLYLRSCLRFIRGLDELQRRIQMEAWLFAALGSLIVVTVITTLNTNGVQWEALEGGLSPEGTFMLTFALWLVGTALANRRYK